MRRNALLVYSLLRLSLNKRTYEKYKINSIRMSRLKPTNEYSTTRDSKDVKQTLAEFDSIPVAKKTSLEAFGQRLSHASNKQWNQLVKMGSKFPKLERNKGIFVEMLLYEWAVQ